jgi:hypothetical protein
MKSFETSFKEGLVKGLRKYKNTPRNTEILLECYNLAPDKDGLVLHEPVVMLGSET